MFEESSTGPVSMTVQYTARYTANGCDAIGFAGTGAEGDNTDVRGAIRVEASGAKPRWSSTSRT